jgi:hypothetical protein
MIMRVIVLFPPVRLSVETFSGTKTEPPTTLRDDHRADAVGQEKTILW